MRSPAVVPFLFTFLCTSVLYASMSSPPPKPLDLPKGDGFFSDRSVQILGRYGDRYCTLNARFQEKLEKEGPSLDPKVSARLKGEVNLLQILCDKNGKWVGYTHLSHENERVYLNHDVLKDALFWAVGACNSASLSCATIQTAINQLDRDDVIYFNPELRQIYGKHEYEEALSKITVWGWDLNKYYRANF